MPNFGYNNQVGQSAANLGDSMSGMAIGLAQLKSQQEQQRQMLDLKRAEMRQQGDLYRAHMKLYEQQGNLHKAEEMLALSKVKKDTSSDEVVFQDLVDYLGREGRMLSPEERAPYESKAMGIAAKLASQGNQHIVQNAAQVLESLNPGMRRVIAAGGADRLYHNVPSGAVAVSPAGEETVQGAYTLPQGSQRYGMQIGEPSLQSPQGPIATGLPPRETVRDNDGANFGRAAQLYGAILGKNPLAPEEDPMYSTATNIMQTVGPRLMNSQGVKKSPVGAPSVGEVRKGYRFKGGDPKDPQSWEKVTQ